MKRLYNITYRWKSSRLIRIALISVWVLGVASCVDDLQENAPSVSNNITFTIGSNRFTEVRSAATEDTVAVDSASLAPVRIPLEVEGVEGLPMEMRTCRNDVTGPFHSAPAGRNAYFDNTTFTAFSVKAYRENATANYAMYYDNSFNDVSANTRIPTGKPWPTDKLTFFAYATSTTIEGFSPSFTMNDGPKGTFSYKVPEPVGETDGKYSDAVNQPDLIFTITQDQTRKNNPVNLEFHHALSALVFKVGEVKPADANNPFSVQSISLIGFKESGTCNFEPATGTTNDEPATSDIQFTWSIEESVNTQIYTQSFTATDLKKDNYVDQATTNTTTFMMIPQTITNDHIIEVKFSIGDRNYTVQKHLNDKAVNLSALQADTKYIFTIGVEGEEVKISVDDRVNNKVKSDVSLRNTGISPGYIRAAIVGYWVEKVKKSDGTTEQAIVAPWSIDKALDGTIDWGTNWDKNWEKGSDGFYYHKHIVNPGQYTHPLFESYTMGDNPPIEGATLELSIIGQIVLARDVAEAWPGTPVAPSPAGSGSN